MRVFLFVMLAGVFCHVTAPVAMAAALTRRAPANSQGDVVVGRGQFYGCIRQASISSYICTCYRISNLAIADLDFFDTTVTLLYVQCSYKIGRYNVSIFDDLPSFIKTVRLFDCFEEEITKEVLHGLEHVDSLDIENLFSLYTGGFDNIYINYTSTGILERRGPLDPVSLDLELFSPLPQLKKLTIQNLYLDTFPEAIYHETNEQAPLQYLEELDLSFNNITELKAEFFYNMPRLRSLDMTSNGIHNLSESPLMIKSLQNLYIRANFIHSLDSSPFKGLPGLDILVVAHMRPRRTVILPGPVNQQYPHRGSLQFIYPSSFAGLSILRRLDLNNHSIQLIQNGTFKHLSNLEYLSLALGILSAIEEDGFEGLQSLKTLDLSFNNLSSIGSSLLNNLPALRSLDFRGNYLESLSDTFFLGVSLLQYLDLGFNRFTDIPKDVFRPLVRLKWLSLHYNYLMSIEGFLSVLSSPNTCEYIDISFNNVLTLDASILPTLAVPEREVTLNLSYNALTTVYASNPFFVYISAIQPREPLVLVLDLRWNRLLSLPFHLDKFRFFSMPRVVIDASDPYRYDKTGRHHRVTLLMSHNPIKCDCRIYELARSIEIAEGGVLYDYTDFKNLTCQYPENLRGIKLVDLSPSQTWCQKWDTSDCPSTCDCLVQGERNSTTSPWNELVNCTGRNISVVPGGLPKTATIIHFEWNSISTIQQTAFMEDSLARELYLTDNNITKIDSIAFRHIPRLEILYLDGNNIDEITGDEFEYLANLRELYLNRSGVGTVQKDAFSHLPLLKVLNLENNLLKALPNNLFSVLTNLQRLSLGGNSFRCDCDILWLKYWMRNKESILNNENITCTHDQNQMQENIRTLSSDNLGCNLADTERKSRITISLSIVVVLLSLLLVVGIVLYKRKKDLQVYLYARYGWRFREEQEDMDKPYDAFLSYSHHDLDFILQHILPGLENREPPFRVCLHHRDFIPGVPIAENILTAVEESRRTIVVVSRNFLDSDWCQLEFQAAHAQVLRDRANRLIMILLEDIPEEDAPPDIRHYIKTKTYLKWGDERFWERLVYAMPRPRQPEDLVQNMEQEPPEMPERPEIQEDAV